MTEVSGNIRQNPMAEATSIRQELTGGRKDIEKRMTGRIREMEKQIRPIDRVLSAYEAGATYRRQWQAYNWAHATSEPVEPDTFIPTREKRIQKLESQKQRGYEETIDILRQEINGYRMGIEEEDAWYNRRNEYGILLQSKEAIEQAEKRVRPWKTDKIEKREILIKQFKRELEIVTAAKKAFLGLGVVAVRSGLLEYKEDEMYYDFESNSYKYGRMGLNRAAAATYGTAVAGALILAGYGGIKSHDATTTVGGEPPSTPTPFVEQADRDIREVPGLVELPPTPEPPPPTRISEPARRVEPPPTSSPTVAPVEMRIPQAPTPAPAPEPTPVPKPTPEVKEAKPKVPEFKNNFSDPRIEQDINILVLPLPPLPQEEIKKSSDILDSMEASGRQEGYYFANIGEQVGPKRAMILPGEYKEGDTQIFYIISPYYGPTALVLTGEEGGYIKNRIHEAVQKGNSAASTPSIPGIKLVDLRENSIGGELTPGAKTDRIAHLKIGQGDERRDVWRGAKQASAAEINSAVVRSAKLSETWRLQDTSAPR